MNGKPDCDIFIQVPEGVSVDLKPGEGLYLNQSLYGLKQSPRMWHQALSNFFAKINFYPTVSDPCLFLCKDDESTFIFVHVDDLIIGGKSIDWVKDLLSSRFEMSDLGEASFVLGIRIVRNRPNRQIFLVQDQYIKNILTEFGMSDCNGTKTPLIPKINGKPNKLEDVPDDSIDYRRAVGLLNYLVQCTRPDLAFTSSFLSQFLLSPTKKSVAGFHHCLQYLKGTADTGILLGKGESRIMSWAVPSMDVRFRAIWSRFWGQWLGDAQNSR